LIQTSRDLRDERVVEPRLGVSTSNWIAPPYNRWGFRHVETVADTATIPRGAAEAREFPRADRNLDALLVTHEGAEYSLEDVLSRTYTDAFLVVNDGAIAFERYFGGMTAGDRHLLMSVSKSLTATLCGVLAGKRRLQSDDLVVDHLQELRGTAWEDCTIQHLLDMRVGLEWDYDVDEYATLDVSAYRTHVRTGLPGSTAEWIRSVRADGKHGERFRYVSLVADVLGWVLERAGGERFAALFSREIWSRLGAEEDALVIVDDEGFPVVEGGICTTARDLARFGQMCLMDGVGPENEQIVPPEWIHRVLVPQADLIQAFRASDESDPARPRAFYHDCWWIWDADQGVYSGSGMNGQALLIHRPSRSVVVKLSTHPGALDMPMFAFQDAAMLAVCEALAAG
jgi:CubicO group peptidase (beta-lactamase class C family)